MKIKMKFKIDDILKWIKNSEDCDKRDVGELKWLKELGYKEIWYYKEKGKWMVPENEIGPEYARFWIVSESTAKVLEKKIAEMKMENISVNKKREFRIGEVIDLVGCCKDCTLDDYMNLLELQRCEFVIVRFVRDVFEDVGGCWIVEKEKYDIKRDIHGGMLACDKRSERYPEMFVKLSYRIEKLLNEVCEDWR